jgi:RsiW-degrading membrane proteinase PrsW (M82 family)
MLATATLSGNDRRLAVIAGAGILFALSAAVARWTGLMPSATGTLVVIVGATIALRVAWSYAATSASSMAKVKTLTLISNVGLAISAVTLLATLPRITQAGGMALMFKDTAAQLWTIALLSVAAGAVRTFGWRVFAGMFLVGFLALSGLARFVGRPIIERLGESSALAVGVCVPILEEVAKLIPVAVILYAALRAKQARPSALDLTLVGAWCGAGFAVYENLTFGRGSFSLTTNSVLSPLYPMAVHGSAFGWPLTQVGHTVHTALMALCIAFYFLYRNREPRARFAPIVGAVSVLLEHCSQNTIAVGGLSKIVARFTVITTLDGMLTPILLAAGVGYVVWLESRAISGKFDPLTTGQLSPAEAGRRSALLAAAQGSTR